MNEYYAWVRRERRKRVIAAIVAWIMVFLAAVGLLTVALMFIVALGLVR